MRLGHYEKAIDIFKDVTRIHTFHIIAHYCISRCQLAMGDLEGARDTVSDIYDLIATNENAAKMWSEYHDLMPEITPPAQKINRKLQRFIY